MYIHAVLFRWKESASAAAIAAVMREFQAFEGRLPGLVEITSGTNVASRNSQGFTHGAVLKFQDRAALDAYSPHPTHQKLLSTLLPLLAEAAELDYEIGLGS